MYKKLIFTVVSLALVACVVNVFAGVPAASQLGLPEWDGTEDFVDPNPRPNEKTEKTNTDNWQRRNWKEKNMRNQDSDGKRVADANEKNAAEAKNSSKRASQKDTGKPYGEEADNKNIEEQNRQIADNAKKNQEQSKKAADDAQALYKKVRKAFDGDDGDMIS
jgi:hypothetical protein